MKKILFVDDEPNVLQGLQRMLRSMRHDWEMAFAQSGQEALEVLERNPFDVVISDMRMPGMNGAQLLTEIMKRHPQAVRIILSGQSDQEAILRSIGPTHQYLAKPCDAEALKSTVARACALRDLLTSEALQQLVSRMATLPSLPGLYCEIVEALQNPEVSLNQVAEIVAKDVGMTAKILQLVNSAFFGLPRQISNVTQAIGLIGLDTIKTLVLSFQIFAQFSEARIPPSVLDALWCHSMLVAKYARQIAQSQGQDRQVIEDAFTAGLLHDAGKLALIANLPTQYAEVLAQAREEGLPLVEAEGVLLGVTHAEVGAYLLGLWGLPDPIVEALAFHHYPAKHLGQGFSPLTAVHVANALAHEMHSTEPAAVPTLVDIEYLAALGFTERLSAWQEACRRTN